MELTLFSFHLSNKLRSSQMLLFSTEKESVEVSPELTDLTPPVFSINSENAPGVLSQSLVEGE